MQTITIAGVLDECGDPQHFIVTDEEPVGVVIVSTLITRWQNEFDEADS